MTDAPSLQLFTEKPELPVRFFYFLASYQSDRLYKLTQTAAESKKPKVTAASAMRISIAEVMANAAFCGIFRKYLAFELENTTSGSAKSRQSTEGGQVATE